MANGDAGRGSSPSPVSMGHRRGISQTISRAQSAPLKQLTPLHPGHRATLQRAAAARTRTGFVDHLNVGPGDLGQGRALMAVLPTRPANTLTAQRLRRRLGQTIRAGRLGRVTGILVQTRLKLDNPVPSRSQLATKLDNRPRRVDQLGAQTHHERGENLRRPRRLTDRHNRTLTSKQVPRLVNSPHHAATARGNRPGPSEVGT